MVSRLALSALLLVAGVLHLARPELFDPAIPFPWKWEINLFAGVLEILLGLGLWPARTRERAAQGTALWFLLLTPVHVYVALEGIAMFGADHPALLWGRTGLQAALFFWALSLQETGWIIAQRWSEVLFLHYEVDGAELQRLVPYPIDRFEGKAVVSIVPFAMGRIRFPFLPPLPGLRQLLELNLRTYVLIEGKPVVYFFTLDANHLIGVLVGRFGFGLPYRWRRLRLTHQARYRLEAQDLSIEAAVTTRALDGAFQRWATERYALVTRYLGVDWIGEVEHPVWSLKEARLLSIDDAFSPPFLKLGPVLGAAYASELFVRFRPFRRVRLGVGPSIST